MRTTIDRAGRIVVPKRLRDRLALGEGGIVDVVERDGVIEIHPAPIEVEMIDGGDGLVAHPVVAVPTLTDAEVLQSLDHVRR